MTREEFTSQIARLTRAYGDKAYPPERTQLIWRRVGHRHEKLLEVAIDNLIADSMQPPMGSKIAEAVYAAAKLYPEMDSDPYAEIRAEIKAGQQRHPCRKCYNWGTVRAYRKDIQGFPEEWLLCDCRYGDLAERLPEYRRMPKWLHYYDFYYVLDSDSASEETLAKFAHVYKLPESERAQEMLRVMAEIQEARS